MSETRTRYRVEGMDCASCASKITSAVRRLPGVEDVSVSVTAGTMTVRHEDAARLRPAILRQVNALGGYTATPLVARAAPENDDHDHDHAVHVATITTRSRIADGPGPTATTIEL